MRRPAVVVSTRPRKHPCRETQAMGGAVHPLESPLTLPRRLLREPEAMERAIGPLPPILRSELYSHIEFLQQMRGRARRASSFVHCYDIPDPGQ